MENNLDRRAIARSNSWKTVEMPTEVASLPFNKTFTAEEFSILSRGFIPQVMEHKTTSKYDPKTRSRVRSVLIDTKFDTISAFARFQHKDSIESERQKYCL